MEVRDCELRVYAGDYNYYLSKIEEEKREAQHAAEMKAKAEKDTARKEKQKAKAKK